MLGAVSAAARVLFAGLPNIQPSTFLIICSGYSLGAFRGFVVGALTAIVSNLLLGHGPWTIYQILAWGLAGASASLLRYTGVSRWKLAIFGILWGYLFGLITNLWFWTGLVSEQSLKTLIGVQIASFPTDTLHAAGNAVFLWFFGERTIRIISRFERRFGAQIPNSSNALAMTSGKKTEASP
jgi:energy-coupling factor transport system substrate-specific component